MKKNIELFLVACLFLSAVCAGVLTLFGGAGIGETGAGTANAAGGTDGRPAITASSAVNDAAKNYGGKLLIGGIGLPLDKTAVYSSTAVGSTARLRATPDSHFTFDKTGHIFKITPSVGEVQFVGFGSGAGDCTEDADGSMVFDLILADVDYEVEVNFVHKVYTLEWSTAYFDGSSASFKNDGFVCTGGSEGVSWGDEISFRNTISANSGGAYERGARFAYAQIKYALGTAYFNMGISDNPTLTIGKAELDAFVQKNGTGGTIQVVGVYVQMIKVDLISDAVSSNNDALQVVTISPVNVQTGGPLKTYNGAKAYYFDKGSSLTIYAFDNTYFKFFRFEIGGQPYMDDDNKPLDVYTIASLDDLKGYSITAHFDAAEFMLYIRGVQVSVEEDEQKNEYYAYGSGSVDIVGAASVRVDGTQKTSSVEGEVIAAFSELSEAVFEKNEKTTGYKFVDIAVKAGKTYYEFDEIKNKVIDEDFINKYVYNNEIVLVVRLVKQYYLSVDVPSGMRDWGSFTVKTVNEGGEHEDVNFEDGNYFDTGTKFVVEAVPNSEYNRFIEFSGVASAEIKEARKAEFNLDYDRTIVVKFKTDPFLITEQSLSDSGFAFSNPDFNVGGTLVITYANLGDNNVISDWKINGQSWKSFGDDAALNGNVLTIAVTTDFLSAFNSNNLVFSEGSYRIDIRNTVTTRMSTGMLLAILIPSTTIPLALAVLATFMLINMRRRKLIKAMLTDQMHREATLNTGSFISKLRDGTTTGEVTKEDVTRAIKEEKRKKSEEGKPVENSGDGEK